VSGPDGTRAGFEEYVAARRAALLRTAYLLTGDHHEAEDLVQVALVKCVAHWAKIAVRPEPYVRTVLVRESITRWRRRRWREVSVTPPELATDGPATDDRLVLQRALAALSPRQRAVVVLRYYEDLTEADTARTLGISAGTVKSYAREGLARLRELLPDRLRDLDTQDVDPVAVRRRPARGARAGRR
jgi:RNA polymerase sigma-70 factor (sigma-E family)